MTVKRNEEVQAVAERDPDEVLPGVVARAWGVAGTAGKGPRPALSLDRIVDAAVDLAVKEGIKGVSMSRLAQSLGVSTMGLYRYVESKDELLLLMVDAGYGPAPAERTPGETWREGLTRWARVQRDAPSPPPPALAL